MQKIRSFSTYISLIVLIVSIFFPVGASFAWEYKYDYSEYSGKINNSFSSGIIDMDYSFESPRTSFSLVFPGYRPSSHADIVVDWIVDGKVYTRNLDLDDKRDGIENIVSTFPFVTSARSSVRVRITSYQARIPHDIEIVTSNQEKVKKSLVWKAG
jgi:hypothetical protein